MEQDARRIPAGEAAARLGVKRETLYAYVSRGMLTSRRALDGKTSTFDPDEVEDLRSRRHRTRTGSVDTVVLSSITQVVDEGLRYRGRDVTLLLAEGFEATARWLWASDGVGEIEDHGDQTSLRDALANLVPALPAEVQPFDRLRMAAALASGLDPLRHDRRPAAVARVGRRLLQAYVECLPLRAPDTGGGLADRLWPRLTAASPAPRHVEALDAALVLLADHDLASSTFAARVAASVRADPYSVAIAGLGAVGGPLHGAASAAVHALFERAERCGSAAMAVGELLGRNGPLPGFGHAVYRRSDPRQRLLHQALREAFGDDRRLEVVEDVTGTARGRTDDVPNVDLALGALTWLAGMDAGAGEVIFAISRTVGWLAHATEEYAEAPLRFRPRSLPR